MITGKQGFDEKWAAEYMQKFDKEIKPLKTRERNGTLYLSRKSSWKQGWREIGGIKKYYRSKWEANYARYLEYLKINKQIKNWQHEPKTFWFEKIKRGVRSYLPDFLVITNTDKEEYHEVKGWMDDKSKTKISRMAKYYPDIKLIIIEKELYNDIKKKISKIISDWEA